MAEALDQCFCCCHKLLRKKDSDEEIREQRLEKIRSQASVPEGEDWTMEVDESAIETSSTMALKEAIHSPPRSIRSILQSIFHASADNKLALKLYGSKKEIVVEQKRQNSNGSCTRWIIHPFSHFRFVHTKHNICV